MLKRCLFANLLISTLKIVERVLPQILHRAATFFPPGRDCIYNCELVLRRQLSFCGSTAELIAHNPTPPIAVETCEYTPTGRAST